MRELFIELLGVGVSDLIVCDTFKRPRVRGCRGLDDHTVEGRAGRQCDVMKWITGAGLDMTA